MSDRKRKSNSSHYDEGNKRTRIYTCSMITNKLVGWIEAVGSTVASYFPWNTFTNSGAGSADALKALREETPIKTRKTKTPTRARTLQASLRSKMASREKATGSHYTRDASPNTNVLPDIESLVMGLDAAEARRVVDSRWDAPELACFPRRIKPVSCAEEDKEKTETRVVVELTQEPEESPFGAKQAKSLPTPPPEVPREGPNDFERSRFGQSSASKSRARNRSLLPKHEHGARSRERSEDKITKDLTSLFEDTVISHRPDTQKLREQERKQKVREEEAKAKADLARKNRRILRQDPVLPLVAPLTPAWEQRVAALGRVGRLDTVVTALSKTPLAGKDFSTLLGRTAWLNDEIINAYLEWIVEAANTAAKAEAKEHGEPDTLVPKFIAQNSFFHNTLKDKGPQATTRLMKRQKAPGTEFLKVDSMLVPICNGNHWTIGVVRPIAKTIEYFDSMGNPANRTAFGRLIRIWLEHQLGASYKAEEWTVPETDCAYQSNGWDCGVFVCTNALCIAHGIHTTCYQERDMIQQRKNIAAILLNRGFVNDFEWTQAGLLA